tara:strand:+ start:2265 stop:3128 length:864 start_codon:yes stop_codon:yes gene_type:complete
MIILVLGSSGQLGMCLKDQLDKKSDDIFYKEKSEINIEDFANTKKELLKLQPDIIVNAAAYTAVDLAEKNFDQANLINHLSVDNLAKIAKKINSTLIHVSTDYVFDGESSNPYKESARTNPKTVYGMTKLNGEKSIIRSKCKHVIIRTSWLFSEYNNNFFKTMLNLAKKNKEITVVSDQYGTPTYAQDLAKAIKKIIYKISINHEVHGIFHYGGNSTCSWSDFASEIFKQSLLNTSVKPISTEEFKTHAIRPVNSSLDSNKLFMSYDIMSSNWKKGISQALKKIKNL